MKKLILLGSFLSTFALCGCSPDFSSTTNLNVEGLTSSGTEMLSGAWNTTKELWTEYYQDQIKPLVDTAKQDAENLWQETKNQYNQGVEQVNEAIQTTANDAKNEVNKLKVE